MTESADALYRPFLRDVPAAAAIGDNASVTPIASVGLSIVNDLYPLESEWRAFEDEADCTVFQTFAWQSAWLKHVAPHLRLTPAIVVGRDPDGSLLFIMPFAVHTDRRGRYLTWLAGDLCDYNGPLLRSDFTERLGRAGFAPLWCEILAMLAADRYCRPDATILEKMPETIGNQPNPFMTLTTSVHPSGAHATRLDNEWDTFYHRRSSATRRHDRAKRKHLAEIGEVLVASPGNESELDLTIDALYRQKGISFARMGVVNLFSRPGHAALFRDFAKNAASRDLVHISRLDVGADPAAVNYGLIFKKRFYHIFASYDEIGEAAKYGPGAIHLLDVMRDAIGRGCEIFDFTIGDEPYKKNWCNLTVGLRDHRTALRWRGMFISVPSAAVAAVKRFIKKSPALWVRALRLRAFLFGRRENGAKAE